MSNAYKSAGVDVHAGYEAVERMKKHVQKTNRPGIMGALGGFGGVFDLSSLQYKQPLLVSGTDGVGTKLLLAIQQKTYNTVGIDCVAMCVNDIVAQGAEPLYFLDYIAVGKNQPQMIEDIVEGVSQGCIQAGAALIGGETAEMPDMYAHDDFDLAGFAVGVVEKDKLIDKGQVKAGDVLIGLQSSGIHSNGYSLVRKIFFKDNDYTLDSQFPELSHSLGQELLVPTRIYVKEILALHQQECVHGVAHITGGGFIENIPRMLSDELTAKIDMDSFEILPIFKVMQRVGKLTQTDMLGTFNLGIGMVVAVPREKLEQAKDILKNSEIKHFVIGEVIDKNQPSQYEGKEVIL
ncbi:MULTISPECIES: phosphoribosylformylglycinamidine cyclo-ligase [unclassified Granulicatella]|uniref:phosphoribosylformylglycinamidine cyclo-ligase n=1 Tax=unclassified Granulicatella TaxID=2630493 RepID=UPI00107397F8|nr:MULTISPECIES: phosphoribosylformylglycinamidine cyclo-ligase [unclassified Granulicatella]MBF0779782.1 phosphoribosylformylglycinamidine cyclo-ligase [Granulicatella sp. 19428wC4_WM01]TFU96184.1 phosphoribosylformylglycinamidine cyclo-ligase [Granulicatella sp. WM01]